MLFERDVGGMPLPRLLTVTCFIAIAWHNVLGLNAIIWFVFRKYNTAYFWTILIASWGVAVHQTGFFLMFFGLAKTWGRAFAITWCGWVTMVTGQSLVLYSRLHLVVRNPRKLQWILGLIIADGVISHITTGIFMVMSHNRPSLAPAFRIFENTGVTLFGLQEVALSVIYIVETSRFMRSSAGFKSGRSKSTLRNVIFANIFIIFLDLAVVALQYADMFSVQVTFKGAVYSVKLYIEFFILNQLVDAVGLESKSGMSGTGYGSGAAKSEVTYNGDVARITIGLDTTQGPMSKHRQTSSSTKNPVTISTRNISRPVAIYVPNPIEKNIFDY